MNKHNHSLKAAASAAVTVCVTFLGRSYGHSTRLFCQNNHGKRFEQNVPHPHAETRGKDDMFISRRPKKK